MKRSLLFTVILIFLFQINPVRSQLPQYTLVAKNFTLVNTTTLTFDLVFIHTDATVLELAGWQFFFKLPQSFGSVGTGTGLNSSFIYDSTGGDAISDLPVGFRPRNPQAVNAGNAPGNYELRLAANSLPGCGNGLVIPQGIPILIGRFKIKTTTPIVFSALNDFDFRDSCETPLSVTRTKINPYDANDCLHREMTRCASHSVDISEPLYNFTLNIKIIPEGLYNTSADKLFRKDTVTAYLRNINSPYQILDTALAAIDSVNFTANCNFINYQTGDYYFSVKTKNSLETWCKSGGINLTPGINSYDMTSSAPQAYGSNMVLQGSRYCIYSGNVNNDQIIDSDDLTLVDNDILNYSGGAALTNLNGDGIVDIVDMAIVDRNAANLILTEWPGLSLEKRNILKKTLISGRP